MRVLVNYEVGEKRYLDVLGYVLKQAGHIAVSSTMAHSPTELMKKAALGSCDAVILINEETLANLVPGKKPTLDQYRGSMLRYEKPVLVVNKLHQMHTVKHGRWLLERDLAKLTRLSARVPQFNFEVLKTTNLFAEAYAFLSECKLMSYDIETITVGAVKNSAEMNDLEDDDEDISDSGGSTIISCAGYTGLHYDGRIRTIVIPFVNFGVDHWDTDEEYASAISLMRDINSLKIHKVMHNGLYDCTHSIRYNAHPLMYTLDTMALAHSEFSELPKTLDFVASLHLPDYIYWKSMSDEASKNKDIQSYWHYNALDCFNTLRVCLAQLRTQPSYAVSNYRRKFKFVYPALYTAFEGFRIDEAKRTELKTAAREQLTKSLQLLRTYFADPNFNPGSWPQVEKYIYRVFGAKKPKIGKSKSCTDEKNLKAVAEQHPLLALLTDQILEYKGAQKAIGTYYNFKQMVGRLLWALDPFGTESGRMACRASALWCGTQIQNIPAYAKPMLIADEGFELDEADNSQSEARCTAYCSQETNLIEALENKEKDFYRTLGTLFFSIPYEEVTDFFRNKVLKKIVHGTNYMMGAGTFLENISVAICHQASALIGIVIVPNPAKGKKLIKRNEMTILNFCKLLLDKYHGPFPMVKKWYEKLFNEVLTTGKVVSPTGHVRKFFGDIRKDHAMLRGIVAHQPQNLSAEILDTGLWRIWRDMVSRPVFPLKLGDYRLKAQIHDSILGQFKKELKDIIIKMKLERMHNPVVVHGRTLVIPVDIKTGNNWAEYDKDTNPEGCKKIKV